MDVLGVEGGRFEIKRGFFEIEPPRATARMGGGMATRKETDASRAAAPLPSLVPRFGSEESEHQLQRLIPLSSSLPKKKPKLLAGHSAHLSLLAFERPPKPLQVVELLHNGMAPACLMEGLHRCDSIMEWNGALKIRESGEVRYIAPTASRERAE